MRSDQVSEKRAKPADLPVEQPAEVELIINMKTAKTLGLTNPQLLLLRADEVIQIPGIYAYREVPEAGGLMSYGPNLLQLYRRAGTYVARILAGANPADLPIEQPTKFELVVNLRTAKTLGLTIPQSVLLRADGVIQ